MERLFTGQTPLKTRQNSSSDHCAAEQPFQTGNEAPTGPTWGQRTSLRTRNQCFPCKVLCPDETHTFPEWNWLFLGTQSLFVSHICSAIPLCGERLASYQSTPDLLSPSYPCWKHTELPVTALARLLNRAMNICIILLSGCTSFCPPHPFFY